MVQRMSRMEQPRCSTAGGGRHLGALEGDGLAQELAAGAHHRKVVLVLVDGHKVPVAGPQPLPECHLERVLRLMSSCHRATWLTSLRVSCDLELGSSCAKHNNTAQVHIHRSSMFWCISQGLIYSGGCGNTKGTVVGKAAFLRYLKTK